MTTAYVGTLIYPGTTGREPQIELLTGGSGSDRNSTPWAKVNAPSPDCCSPVDFSAGVATLVWRPTGPAPSFVLPIAVVGEGEISNALDSPSSAVVREQPSIPVTLPLILQQPGTEQQRVAYSLRMDHGYAAQLTGSETSFHLSLVGIDVSAEIK